MATQVVRTSELPAEAVVQRLAATIPPPPRPRGLDRFTGGFDIADAMRIEGAVYRSGHVEVAVRYGVGRKHQIRAALSGRVSDDARGGSRFEGTLGPSDEVRAFTVLWLGFVSLMFVFGLVAEVRTVATGGSATEYLAIPIFAAVMLLLGLVATVSAERESEHRDGPVLLDWLDAGCATTASDEVPTIRP